MIGGLKIEISWPANTESDLGGYRVYRRTSPADEWELIAEVDANTTTYTDENVTAGKTYDYRVTAIDKAGLESDTSPGVSTTVPEPSEEFPWILLWISIIIVIIVVLILLFALLKRHKPEEMPKERPPPPPGLARRELPPPPGVPPKKRLPPPPPQWMKTGRK